MNRSKFKTWRKASRSDAGGNCVEVSFADDGTVGVRDSKNPDGPILVFTRAKFGAFIAGVRNGEFDLEPTLHH
jgi:hypothetical protein